MFLSFEKIIKEIKLTDKSDRKCEILEKNNFVTS